MIEWLEVEIAAARAHIADFDSGAVVKRNGSDVTAAWRSEYVDRVAKLEVILARQTGEAK